jgi:hypothetical protein
MATKRIKPRLDVTLPPEMVAWLKRSAAKQMVSLSAAVQAALMPAFERRHAK